MLFPQDHLMFPRMLMKLVSLRTLSSVHSEQVFALRLQDKKLPPLLSEIWDVNEWLQTWCHTPWLFEAWDRHGYPAGTLTSLCPSGHGLVLGLSCFFFLWEESLYCSQTRLLKWFCVHKEKHEHLVFLWAFCCSSFCVDADMIVTILNTSIGLFSQLSLI